MEDDQELVPIRISDREQVLSIGVYTVTRILGRGSAGVVYEVVDPSGAVLALKTIEPRFMRLPESTAHRRFLQEAALLAKLRHPNIVRLHDFGMAGHPFGYPLACLVMERIDGDPLDALMSSVTMTPHEILSMAAQVADALVYLDEHGVVHRDIKPSNLILRRDGTVVLVDFGVARSREHTRITKERDLVGTLKYMSPERLSMKKDSDIRGDIYALGLIMFELVARKDPRNGTEWPISIAMDGGLADMRRMIDAMTAEVPEKRPPPSALRAWIKRIEKTTTVSSDFEDDTVLSPEGIETARAPVPEVLPKTAELTAPKPTKRWVLPAAIAALLLAIASGWILLRPDEATAAFLEGEAALKRGDHRVAIAFLEHAVALDEEDPRAHRRLADAFLTAGDIELARRHYRRYLELAPDAPDAEGVRRVLDDR